MDKHQIFRCIILQYKNKVGFKIEMNNPQASSLPTTTSVIVISQLSSQLALMLILKNGRSIVICKGSIQQRVHWVL